MMQGALEARMSRAFDGRKVLLLVDQTSRTYRLNRVAGTLFIVPFNG
jgi:hypothetical protein